MELDKAVTILDKLLDKSSSEIDITSFSNTMDVAHFGEQSKIANLILPWNFKSKVTRSEEKVKINQIVQSVSGCVG